MHLIARAPAMLQDSKITLGCLAVLIFELWHLQGFLALPSVQSSHLVSLGFRGRDIRSSSAFFPSAVNLLTRIPYSHHGLPTHFYLQHSVKKRCSNGSSYFAMSSIISVYQIQQSVWMVQKLIFSLITNTMNTSHNHRGSR
ncbi:Protein of unknown function [Pyronema omphalodes CBS 100304]|uniref:Uncharacterized protein n=1 Tax=Pyronema omphalodes (strain CBS 100304) TaxID=1076935 RepID=U4LJC4_PYROM|nr:Protein of unknown function [Pyronema omphalodes CBS 100304]